MHSSASSAATISPISRRGVWLLLFAAALLPVSLLWDFSWECTVGVDLFWSPPHALTYAAIVLAAMGALALMRAAKDDPASRVSRLGLVAMPLGGWLVAWGTLAFVAAVFFDRWWQSAYGLQAGIWHPPQILKATAFFVVLSGVWLVMAAAQRDLPLAATLFVCAGGWLLVLSATVTLTPSYPNLQHSASFYKITGAAYPVVLAALAIAGRRRWSATLAALVYTIVVAGLVWVLPRFGARPMTGPIYNPLDHLMPPPFPLLLVVPALAMDWLMKQVRWPAWRGVAWLQAGALGLVFFVLFLGVQWFFSKFLLTPGADNWFFAGGGRHWPFFLKITPPVRTMFWNSPTDMMNWSSALGVATLSIASARLGLWLGAWQLRLQR